MAKATSLPASLAQKSSDACAVLRTAGPQRVDYRQDSERLRFTWFLL